METVDHNRVSLVSGNANRPRGGNLTKGKRCPGLKYSSRPGNTPSIPTKYQTVMISNTEKKGFSSKTQRFLTMGKNETPGPSTYFSQQSAEPFSPSFSSKGTGTFASQASRTPVDPHSCVPGPSAYNLQASLLCKHSSRKGCSRAFCLPIATKAEEPKDSTPAPNHYHVSFRGIERNITVSARSAFLSQTRRGSLWQCPADSPSPCHYTVTDALTRTSTKVPDSSFKSGTARIQPLPIFETPGPGTYEPNLPPESVKRTPFLKRRYPVLAAHPVALSKTPPLPGPGHYDVVDYKGPPKHYMSSAVFKSGTSRWTNYIKSNGWPGPGVYEPKNPSKQSFLFNHNERWIPV